MIPKKLHFTFAIKKLPSIYRKNLKRWKKMHPDWELSFYSDDEIYGFFKEHFPHYYDELPNIPYGAMLADLFRYGVLYIYGGLYSDIDTFPLKKIPKEWLEYDCVLGYEYQPSKFPDSYRSYWGEQEFLCQWTLLSAPRYLFYKAALDSGFQKLRALNYQVKRARDVLYTSGPLMITEIFGSYQYGHELLLIDADYFGCCENNNFPFTDRSVVYHQFRGKTNWEVEVMLSRLNWKYR